MERADLATLHDEDAFVLTTYQDARAALFHRGLSRTLDKRTFTEGNVREGVLSVLHGTEHRNRRRIENRLFRSARLVLYERELFPRIVEQTLDRVVADGRADLFLMGHLLSIVLAARTAGIDHEADSLAELNQLVECVGVFSQATAIEDTLGDTEAVRARVTRTLDEFQARFLAPSRARREQRMVDDADDRPSGGTSDTSDDVLTTLLLHLDDDELGIDDGLILREVATYLQAGTHTSAQTLINTLDLLFAWRERHPEDWARQRGSRLFLQRCVHEALRVRPTNPGIRRLAEQPTVVAGHPVDRGDLIIINTYAANQDPEVFGTDAATFDPNRVIPEGVPRWGLSFGGGMHTCIGRTLAAGLPAPGPPADRAPADHLYGLVTLMVEAAVRREVAPDPERPGVPDTRTRRWTRWREYPAVFGQGH